MPRSGRHARHSNSLLSRFFLALRALKAPSAPFGSSRRIIAALLAVTVATLGIAATGAQAVGTGDIEKTLDATQGTGFTAPNTFSAGSLVRYNVKVSCSSNTSDCGIGTLVDSLPAGVTFKNVVSPVTSLPLNVASSGQTVTITIGDASTPWPDGSTLEFVIVGTVTGTVTGTLNNQASITTNGGSVLSQIVPIIVPTPSNGLSATKSVTPSTIAPGEIATYSMRFSFPVTAQGQTPPTGATMVDTYPAGAIPVLANGTPIADGGTTADGGVVNLAAHTITYTYTAAQLDPTKAKCWPVTYCVMGDKALYLRFPSPPFAAGDTPVNVTNVTFSFADGTTSKATAQATVTIQTATQAPVLTKSGPTAVAPGQTFYWTINAKNNGNGTVTNYSVTDTLPTSGVGSLIIYGEYAPTYEPITGTPTTATFEYMDASGVWQPWFVFTPGDQFLPRAVPAGAVKIRVTAASLTPKSEIYFRLKATVTGDVDSTFKNCVSLTGDGLTTPPADACVTSTVNAPFSSLAVYKGHVFADSGATSVAPGDTFIYYVNVKNMGGVPLTSIDFSDVLPSAFTYVKTLCTYDYPTLNLEMTLAPNSWYTPCNSATAIEPTVTANAPTAGSTLLQWNDVPVTSTAVRDGANAMGIAFEVKVKPGTSVANYTNVIDVNNAQPGVTTQCANGTSTVTDTNDVNGDGSTTDILCQNTNPVQVRQAAVADVFKWVKGDLGVNALETTGLPSSTCPDLDGYTRYPCVAEVSRGGTFDYLFQHVNTGNVQMTDFTMYDILPHVGDTGVNQVLATSPRDTVWDPVLTGPVTLDPATVPTGANPVIMYSLSYDPCRPELAQGTPGTNWQGAACTDPVGGTNVQNTWYTAAQITDWSTVKSFKISMFTGQTDLALAWQPFDEIVAHAPMQAPATAPESTQSPLSLSAAWNSIAHQEARLNSDGTTNPLLAAAPRKVGIIVPFPGVSVGDYVWFDQNHDGLQSPGETPIEGVTVTLKDASGAVVKTTTTDANGYYSFLYLTPSTQYTVEFTAPTGMTFTTPNASGVTSNDPIADNGTTALNGTTGGDSDAIPSTDGLLGSVTFTSPAKDGSLNEISSLTAGTVADNPGLDAGGTTAPTTTTPPVTETETTTPTETATETTTPTETATETTTPTETATETAIETPVTTPTATPTAAEQGGLPVTGAAGLNVLLLFAAVLIGSGALMLVARSRDSKR